MPPKGKEPEVKANLDPLADERQLEGNQTPGAEPSNADMPVREAEDVTDEDEDEYVPQHVVDGGRDYRVEGNDVRDYIGVDPEYMTYASETEKPSLTHVERFEYTNQYDHLEGNADEESDEDESDKDEESK